MSAELRDALAEVERLRGEAADWQRSATEWMERTRVADAERASLRAVLAETEENVAAVIKAWFNSPGTAAEAALAVLAALRARAAGPQVLPPAETTLTEGELQRARASLERIRQELAAAPAGPSCTGTVPPDSGPRRSAICTCASTYRGDLCERCGGLILTRLDVRHVGVDPAAVVDGVESPKDAGDGS